MSFAVKHRPKALSEVVGNGVVKKVISEMIQNLSFTHVMFEGDTGSGKTTFAYILAKEFSGIEENIFNINCMFSSGVEEMRNKLEELRKTSLFGINKVLILDEIHGLSNQAQNVFLKPLEDGLPSYVLIIACTTSVEKLSPMLLDRFKRLRVKPLVDSEAIQLIDRISSLENITTEKWKKALILEKSAGIPRRILSGLEKVKSITDKSEVELLLDISSLEEEDPDILKLFKWILSKADWNIIKHQLDILLKTGKSPESIRIGIVNLIASRLTSNYSNEIERSRLSKLYFNYLRQMLGVPDKANLINLIYLMTKGD